MEALGRGGYEGDDTVKDGFRSSGGGKFRSKGTVGAGYLRHCSQSKIL